MYKKILMWEHRRTIGEVRRPPYLPSGRTWHPGGAPAPLNFRSPTLKQPSSTSWEVEDKSAERQDRSGKRTEWASGLLGCSPITLYGPYFTFGEARAQPEAVTDCSKQKPSLSLAPASQHPAPSGRSAPEPPSFCPVCRCVVLLEKVRHFSSAPNLPHTWLVMVSRCLLNWL